MRMLVNGVFKLVGDGRNELRAPLGMFDNRQHAFINRSESNHKNARQQHHHDIEGAAAG